MKRKYMFVLAIIMLAASMSLAGCGQMTEAAAVDEIRPAKVERLEGAQPTRVTLTADAAERLDIQTAEARDGELGGVRRLVIPYAALLYDTEGNTWTYVNSATLAFVRYAVTVDRIEGEQAFLLAGPPSGSRVVTVGAAELYGSETEFAEE
jgi:hypothetical protein